MNYNICPFKNEFGGKSWSELPKERLWKAYLYFCMQRDHEELQKKADSLFEASKGPYHYIKKKHYYDRGKFYKGIIKRYSYQDAECFINEIIKAFNVVGEKNYFEHQIHCARLDYDVKYMREIREDAITAGMLAHARGERKHITGWPQSDHGQYGEEDE